MEDLSAVHQHQVVATAAYEVMKKTFGEENVDKKRRTQLNTGAFQTVFIIRFPKFTIRNAKGHTHEIIELYVKIAIENNGLSDMFRGTRGKLTQLEAASNYCHSHLDTYSTSDFDGFCRGSSNFHHVQSILQSESWLDSNNNVSEDKLLIFEGWLFEMIGFLEWESIEGTPYRYMKNIGRGNNTARITDDDVKFSYLRFLKLADFTRLKLRFNIDKYELQADSIFEEEVLKCATKFQFKSDDGKFYDTTTLHPVGPKPDYASFTFKGERVHLTVVPSEINADNREVFAHRTIKNKIYEYLQRELQSVQQRYARQKEGEGIAHRITRVRDTYSKRSLLPENLVPVSEGS